MLGEYLVPPIINFNVNLRGSDDEIVYPEHVEDYSTVASRRLRGKSSRLCGGSNEDNGVTSTTIKAFRTCEAANEGQTSIEDEALQTCEASDDEVFRTREASNEDSGLTSAVDHIAYDEVFRTREASNEDNGLTSTARLHIPAGILRIPVFSVPIACFSQESQFSFRSNLVYRNKKEQKPSQ